jgi:hypothetical protein
VTFATLKTQAIMAYPKHGDYECRPRRILADHSDLEVMKPSLGLTRSLLTIRNCREFLELDVSQLGSSVKRTKPFYAPNVLEQLL